MFIEAVHTKSKTEGATKGTVVLLHGVCFGAWYWESNFQPWFAARGYDVIAISYRNHGNSEKQGSLKWRSIHEYVQDVHGVISEIKGDIFIIGHSMGGFITQHYLQQYPSAQIKKAVLLCTVPDSGIALATWRVCKTFPFSFLKGLFTLSFIPVFNSKVKAKKLMFAPTVPDALTDEVVPRMQDESFRAYIDMMLLNLPSLRSNKIPLLIIGGTEDYLVRPYDLQKTAKRLNTTVEIMKGGHNINMEDGWEKVAERIDLFFNE